MEIAYNNNEAKKFYQEVQSIRRGFKQETLLISDKEGNSKQQRRSPTNVV